MAQKLIMIQLGHLNSIFKLKINMKKIVISTLSHNLQIANIYPILSLLEYISPNLLVYLAIHRFYCFWD